MKAKFYFLTFVAALAAVSCVDDGYDLSEVTTDDITIGDENSVFEIPVATFTLSPDNLNSTESSGAVGFSASQDVLVTRASDMSSFSDLLDIANGFLPSGETIDIAALTDDATSESEVERITELLVDEILVSDSKSMALAEILHDYIDDSDNNEEVADLLEFLNIDTSATDTTVDDIYNAVIDLRSSTDAEVEEFKELMADVILENLVVDLKSYSNMAVEESVEPISIPSDIIDIITSGSSSYAGSVKIVITYEHNFPFSLDVDELTFSNSASDPSAMVFPITPAGETTVKTEVDFDNFVSILESGDGAQISTSLNLVDYLYSDYSGDYWLKLKISVVKEGAISFN